MLDRIDSYSGDSTDILFEGIKEKVIAKFSSENHVLLDNSIVLKQASEKDFWREGLLKQIDEIKNIPISELYLSARSYNCLERAGINTVGDLLARDEEDLKNIRNFGRRSFEEVTEKIEEYKGYIQQKEEKLRERDLVTPVTPEKEYKKILEEKKQGTYESTPAEEYERIKKEEQLERRMQQDAELDDILSKAAQLEQLQARENDMQSEQENEK